jgi:hypothetical protein
MLLLLIDFHFCFFGFASCSSLYLFLHLTSRFALLFSLFNSFSCFHFFRFLPFLLFFYVTYTSLVKYFSIASSFLCLLVSIVIVSSCSFFFVYLFLEFYVFFRRNTHVNIAHYIYVSIYTYKRTDYDYYLTLYFFFLPSFLSVFSFDCCSNLFVFLVVVSVDLSFFLSCPPDLIPHYIYFCNQSHIYTHHLESL